MSKETSPFGQYVRRKRLEAGLSSREVAERMGVGVSHVYLREVESGRRKPLPKTWWEILAEAVPGVETLDLEVAAAKTQPVIISLENASDECRELVLLLKSLIESDSLSTRSAKKLLAVLNRGKF